MRSSLCPIVLGACLVAMSPGSARSDPSARDSAGRSQPEGIALESGLLIVEGKYVPPPYTIALADGQLAINGVALDAEIFSSSFDDWDGSGRMGGDRRARDSDSARDSDDERTRRNVERHLFEDGLIAKLAGGETIAVEDGLYVAETLLSDMPAFEKLRELTLDDYTGVTSRQWKSFIDEFQPAEELRQRVAVEFEGDGAYVTGQDVRHSHSQSAVYLLTLLGMGLSVLSFGVAVNYRPRQGVKFGERNATREGVRLVLFCGALIALLNVFDLVCTIVAEGTGGFWEINPMSAQFMGDPLSLLSFKLSVVSASVLILFRLRHYQATQVASWWLCVFMTLLSIRWVSVNSLLMT